MRGFIWIPIWAHLEQPFMGGYGLGRLRWGWVEMDEQQWLDARRREAVVGSVVAGCVVVALATLILSGCKC